MLSGETMKRLTGTLLSVAGFDPSGGAGILLDVSVFNRFGFHGSAVLTALTVQNTLEVKKLSALPASFILEQFRALSGDLKIKGVKFGLLGGGEGIKAMKEILDRLPAVPRVVDPVFRSSSGFRFMEKRFLDEFLNAVRGRVSLLTPNLPEAEVMTGLKPRGIEEMRRTARLIHEMTGVPCLLKGGHLTGRVADVLFDGRRFLVLRHAKIAGGAHGTGCYLSAAVLARLARGDTLGRACRTAVVATASALASSSAVGRGRAVLRDFAPRKAARR